MESTVTFSVVLVIFLANQLCMGQFKQKPGCYPKADVVFLVDGSDSISDDEFQQQMQFIRIFVKQTEIGFDKIRTGVIVISSNVGDTISLIESTNNSDVLNKLQTLTQPKDGSRTDLGLVYMEQMFLEHGREKVARIGVLLTDGRAKYIQATEGEAAATKQNGIYLIAIGVGRLILDAQLQIIASTINDAYHLVPEKKSTILLLDTVFYLGESFCASTTSATQTTLPTTTIPPKITTTVKTTTTVTATIPSTTTVTTIKLTTRRPSTTQLPNPTKISKQPSYQANASGVQKSWFHVPFFNVVQQHPEAISVVKSIQHEVKKEPNIVPHEREFLIISDNGNNKMKAETDNASPTKVETEGDKEEKLTDQSSFKIGKLQQSARNTWGILKTKLFDIDLPFKVPFELEKKKHEPDSQKQHTEHQKQPTQLQRTRRPPTRRITTPSTPTTSTTTITTISPSTKHAHRDANSEEGHSHRHNHAFYTDLCWKSRFVDGVGYNADPESCTEFIQCFYDGGNIKMERARCPFRTFWDERLLICRPSSQRSCWRDPCFDFTVQNYDHKGNCRAYWTCESGLSQPKCCPEGFSFTSGQGCVNNPACLDECQESGELTFNAPFLSCRMTPLETNARFYFEKIPGLGMMIRSCPRGSRFNPQLCTCDMSADPQQNLCRPELILDFQDDLTDKSGNNLAATQQNVMIELGAGRFNGNSKMTLWRFSGGSFGSTIAIQMKFKTNSSEASDDPMHLISNCCCNNNPGPSLDIAIMPDNGGGTALFLAASEKSGEVFIDVPYKNGPGGWNEIKYIYDGHELTGTVNGVKVTKKMTGEIEGRPTALQLGSCDVSGAFSGLIDDVRLYLCAPVGL
ncbi:hypothetical protein CHS0354_019819 [Potamilus streckersoni]|uniref:Uncharacterized protein n=1 Tax=Potamilus streckersoni TaxID=2493646 RepID=A0AAE0TEQ1_9BIVA|nr:hypothetical protein CHS0354_019819 [Potamilus streckersoni]